MYTLRKVLSVLLVLILIPLLWGQIAATAVRSLLVEPELLKRLAHESGLYVEAQRVMSRDVRIDSGGLFTQSDMERIINRALPADQLAILGDATIDGLHFWLIAGAERPVITLPLAPIKENLRQVLREELDLKAKSLPVCTKEQLIQWQTSTREIRITCRPADERLTREYLDRAMAGLDLNQIPDTLDLAKAMEGSEGPQFWVRARGELAGLRLFLTLVPWGWVAIGVLLLLLALLNLDRWYSPFGWIASVLLIGGGLLFIAGLSATHFAVPLMSSSFPGDLGPNLGPDLAVRAVGAFAASLRNLSLLISLIGLGSLILTVAGAILSPKPPVAQTPATFPPQNTGTM